MPLMQPPAGWRNVTRGGRRVPAEGLDVSEAELPKLVAQGWTPATKKDAPAEVVGEQAAEAAEGEVVK